MARGSYGGKAESLLVIRRGSGVDSLAHIARVLKRPGERKPSHQREAITMKLLVRRFPLIGLALVIWWTVGGRVEAY